jgi:hypothetical protein
MTSSGAAYSDPSDWEDPKTADPYRRTRYSQDAIPEWRLDSIQALT